MLSPTSAGACDNRAIPMSESAPMLRRLLRAAFMAIWIVPESQIRVLSLNYQEHLFRLFHERPLNRFSHYIGIPMALSTMYAALPVSWAAAVALAIALLHSAIAIRNRLWMMCAVAAAAQGMLVTFGACILSPFYATPSSLWFSPWLHIIGWSFLQYSTHWLEPRIPEPWGTKPMMPKREWLRERGFPASVPCCCRPPVARLGRMGFESAKPVSDLAAPRALVRLSFCRAAKNG
jgi:hypothetical protein